MARFNIPYLLVLIAALSMSSVSHAQIFGGGPDFGSGENGTGRNSVDFDLTGIIGCQSDDTSSEEVPLIVICSFYLEELLDQLVEAESVLDEIFNGYRSDSPRFFRNQLDGPVQIEVVFAAIDGPGGALATAGPHPDATSFEELYAFFGVRPFLLQNQDQLRNWVIPRRAQMNLDVDDIIPLLITELMIDVAVHEAFHAMGHTGVADPNVDPPAGGAFVMSNLTRATTGFGQFNFLGDQTGINGVGYGLTEFRQESGNPLATFIPLSQNDEASHLSAFEPVFNRTDEGFQDAFTPFAPPPGIQGIMSFSLQGMFADLGYRVRGINSPGFIDLDNDGKADDPVIINPIQGDHN